MKNPAAVLILSVLFSGCVIWKSARAVEAPQTDGKITDRAQKIVFDTGKAPESSGVENIFGDENYFITHGDSFCPSAVYGMQVEDGEIVRYDEFRLKGGTQFDWEDTASSVDENGNRTLYLADIGDNWRFRTWKTIYVITKIENDRAVVDRKIRFRCVRDGKTVYADTEALFFYGGALYVMTKNSGKALMFRIPLDEGDRVDAEFVQSVSVPSLITSAAATDDGAVLAVLSLEYLYFYDISGGTDNLDSKVIKIYSASGCRQCEGVCFTRDGRVAVTNEQGELYLFSVDF